mmetsp:Transcript_22877/g.47577  ORF Transcript_22877/g.47577 Transcript_22877/m.47577 type:complete len:202 (-) Transcript_22877:188-793(-)
MKRRPYRLSTLTGFSLRCIRRRLGATYCSCAWRPAKTTLLTTLLTTSMKPKKPKPMTEKRNLNRQLPLLLPTRRRNHRSRRAMLVAKSAATSRRSRTTTTTTEAMLTPALTPTLLQPRLQHPKLLPPPPRATTTSSSITLGTNISSLPPGRTYPNTKSTTVAQRRSRRGPGEGRTRTTMMIPMKSLRWERRRMTTMTRRWA